MTANTYLLEQIDESNAADYQGGFIGLGGFFIRPYTIKAGEKHKGHSHYIDHVGNLVSGQAILRWKREDGSKSGEVRVLKPCKLFIAKDVWHEIEAITDCQWECWFASAEADKEYGDRASVPYNLEKP